MATRLDTGNIQLRQPGGVPMRQIEPRSVQYIAGKAQAESNQVLGQMLDRMSAGILDYAGKLRIEEGLKWSAENQITKEQLFDSHGELLDTDIGGGVLIKNGKVQKSALSMLPSKFNEAVRKARSAQLSNLFLQEGNSELVKIIDAIDAGDRSASSEKVLEKIKTFTKASSEVLAEVDPEAAIRFSATMATNGNAVYKSALKSESQRNKSLREAKFLLAVDDESKIMEQQIAENPQILSFIYGAGLARLEQSVLLDGVSPEMASKYIDDYKKRYGNAKINVLTRHYMSSMDDVYETLLKIQKGDAGNLSVLLKEMQLSADVDSIAKITANVMTASNQREQLKKDKRQEDKENKTIEANNLLAEIYPLNKKDPKREVLVKKALALNVLPQGVIKDLREPDKAAEGNANTAYNAYNAIQKNIIKNVEDLDKIPGLSPEQRLTLAKEFYRKDKEDSKTLTRTINELSGLPTDENVMVSLNPDSSQFKSKVKLEADAERIRSEAEAKGQILKGSQIANLLKQEVIARRSSIEAKQAQESLDNYAIGRDGKPKKGREWIPGPVNKNTLGALKEVAKKITNPEERRRAVNQILEIESLIEKAEGNK